MITARIDAALATTKLNALMLRLNNTSVFFKLWGTATLMQAKNNAVKKGGKKLWRKIASATRLHSVSGRSAVVQCFDYIGPHKEYGGPIQAKKGKYLAIPLTAEAQGINPREMSVRGVKLFRPGKAKILAVMNGKTMNPLYALCERTAPQKPDKWWPELKVIIDRGIDIAKKHIGI